MQWLSEGHTSLEQMSEDTHAGKGRKRPRAHAGSALQKASKARLSTYDAKHAQQQKRALKSKQVNQYRKLVKRLKTSNPTQPPVSARQASAQRLLLPSCRLGGADRCSS